jgi:hypothetical protein
MKKQTNSPRTQPYQSRKAGWTRREAIREEDALQLPSGKYELPLILRDANFDNRGNLL